jgi:predicted dehydrogenase
MTEQQRVLVIGVGSIGERHVRCFQATGRADVAICEPNLAIRDTVANRYGIAKCYTSLENALEHPFDLAVVATPAPFHIPQARELVDCGISPLIEKPLSLCLEGLPELESSVAMRPITAGVAYPFRAHPSVAGMRAAILEGRFGIPLQVTVVAGQHFPTYRPAYRDIYYRDRATGGGAIQDALTHMINAVEWIVGPTTRVVADAERLKLDGVAVEDTAHAIARNGDVLVTYSLNQHQPANELSVSVVCERGQTRFEGHHARWSWTTEVDGAWQEETTTLDRDTLFRRQAEEFIAAIAGRTPPLCTLAEGRATVQTVLAILKSLTTRQWESTSQSN